MTASPQGSGAVPEPIISLARATLARFDLPSEGEHGAKATASAMAGAVLVDQIARMAGSRGALYPEAVEVIKAVTQTAIDGLMVLVDEGEPCPATT